MPERAGSRLLNAAAYAVIGLAFLVLLVIAWTVLYPITPGTEIRSIEVLTPVVVAGEDMEVEIDYCKSVPGSATTALTIVTSEQMVYLSPTTSNRPLGCDDVLLVVPVPDNAPSGVAHLEVDIERRYSALHLDVISGRSNDFRIVGN